jgi:hypothetical protein
MRISDKITDFLFIKIMIGNVIFIRACISHRRDEKRIHFSQ